MSGAPPVVVFCGGDAPLSAELAFLPASPVVIAADHGLDHAMAANMAPVLAVGDFDSASPEAIAWAKSRGTVIQDYAVAKDSTDFELAMDAAVGMEPDAIHVVGIAGGRLDHLLGNLAVLTRPEFATIPCVASGGGALITVIHGPGSRVVMGDVGSVLSLIPMAADVHDVSTSGLEYRLSGDKLTHHLSRGLSNVFVEAEAKICVGEGVLLAVQPEYFR